MAPLPSLPILQPSVATNNQTGSPIVSTHGLTSDSRIESRTHAISDTHNTLRGNIQATTQSTTIQVIASGNQVHLPTTLLSTKGFNSSPNMLKIGVSSHSNATITPLSTPGFKLGIGWLIIFHDDNFNTLTILHKL